MVDCTPKQPGRPGQACVPATPTTSLSSQRPLSTTSYHSSWISSMATSTTRSSTTSFSPVATMTPPVGTSVIHSSSSSSGSESSFKTSSTTTNSSHDGPTKPLLSRTMSTLSIPSVVVRTAYSMSNYQLTSTIHASVASSSGTSSNLTPSPLDDVSSESIVSLAPNSVSSPIGLPTDTPGEPRSSEGPSTTSQRNSSGSSRSSAGAIAGGLLGGLAFLVIVLTSLVILRRRLRARRTAPSAEFMHARRNDNAGAGALSTGGETPEWFHADRSDGAATPVHDQLLSHAQLTDSAESSLEDYPPTSGRDNRYYVYPTDPVLEKAREAAGMWELYRRRSESFATAQELSLHEEESEGHVGSAENEKGGYAFAL